jgi:hypothetical protein
MRNYLIKSVLALVCLSTMSVPLSAQKIKPGGSGGTSGGCATAGISGLSRTTASPGDGFALSGGLSNCTARKQRYLVEMTFTSVCGVETTLVSTLLQFSPFENKLLSMVSAVPAGTCLGAGVVTLKVSDGSSLLTSASVPLTIQ